jgi:hypothetical protein
LVGAGGVCRFGVVAAILHSGSAGAAEGGLARGVDKEP